MIHYMPKFFNNAVDPITVAVIGAGATGSQVVTQLGRINEVLQQIGHRGLYVTLYDDDIVNEHNVGKQLFAKSETGEFKASSIISRINRFYGTGWEAYNHKVHINKIPAANVVITCIDSFPFRKQLNTKLIKERNKEIKNGRFNVPNHKRRYYWLDIGNEANFGQIFLSTTDRITQPSNEMPKVLMSALEIFPKAKIDLSKQAITCSMAESLLKQDLFINSILAQYASHLLWTMFTAGYLDYQGIFVNLSTLNTSKYPIYEPNSNSKHNRGKRNPRSKTKKKLG